MQSSGDGFASTRAMEKGTANELHGFEHITRGPFTKAMNVFASPDSVGLLNSDTEKIAAPTSLEVKFALVARSAEQGHQATTGASAVAAANTVHGHSTRITTNNK
jgi:hypothetical protein